MRGTAILLQALMGFNRLPGKSLRDPQDTRCWRTPSMRLWRAAIRSSSRDHDRRRTTVLVAAAEDLKAHVFRGAEDDDVDRFAQAARHFELHRVAGLQPTTRLSTSMRCRVRSRPRSHRFRPRRRVRTADRRLRGSDEGECAAESGGAGDRPPTTYEHVTPHIRRGQVSRCCQRWRPAICAGAGW